MSKPKYVDVEDEFVLEQSNANPNEWRVWQKSYDNSPGLNPYRYFGTEKKARKYINENIESERQTLRRIRLGWAERERFKVSLEEE